MSGVMGHCPPGCLVTCQTLGLISHMELLSVTLGLHSPFYKPGPQGQLFLQFSSNSLRIFNSLTFHQTLLARSQSFPLRHSVGSWIVSGRASLVSLQAENDTPFLVLTLIIKIGSKYLLRRAAWLPVTAH